MPPWKYPTPTASPFEDAQQYIALLLGAIDLELDRADAWEDAEANTALGYIEDLKQYIMLNFGATAQGVSMDYVRLSHTLPNNTNGGSTISGSWQTRPVNTKNTDDSNICTLSDNEFTLAAGTYDFLASGVFYNDSNFQRMRLYNVDDATTLILGETLRYGQTGNVTIQNTIRGRFTLGTAKTLRLEYRIGTARATDGLGLRSNYGVDEVYAIVELWRI